LEEIDVHREYAIEESYPARKVNRGDRRGKWFAGSCRQGPTPIRQRTSHGAHNRNAPAPEKAVFEVYRLLNQYD